MAELKTTAEQEAKKFSKRVQDLQNETFNECPGVKILFKEFVESFVQSVKLLNKAKAELMNTSYADIFDDQCVSFVYDNSSIPSYLEECEILPNNIAISLEETTALYKELTKILYIIDTDFGVKVRQYKGKIQFYDDSDRTNLIKLMFGSIEHNVDFP